eukprot:Clim_evm92s156 gene=Clim_evmTU92s156
MKEVSRSDYDRNDLFYRANEEQIRVYRKQMLRTLILGAILTTVAIYVLLALPTQKTTPITSRSSFKFSSILDGKEVTAGFISILVGCAFYCYTMTIYYVNVDVESTAGLKRYRPLYVEVVVFGLTIILAHEVYGAAFEMVDFTLREKICGYSPYLLCQ